MTDKSITETLKAKLDELEVERHLNDLVDETEKVVGQAVEKVGEFTHQHRGDINGFLDRATTTINEKTDGKYADQVSRVVLQVQDGVTKLAARRPVDDAGAPDDAPGESPSLPGGDTPPVAEPTPEPDLAPPAGEPIDPTDPTSPPA